MKKINKLVPLVKPHLMRLQVDDVREAWLLVKVEDDSNLVEIRGHLTVVVTITVTHNGLGLEYPNAKEFKSMPISIIIMLRT